MATLSNDEKRKFKVSRELTLAKQYRGWEEWEVGDIVIGEVVGVHEDKKYNQKSPVIKVIDAQFKKDAKKFTGRNLVLNSTGMMRNAMPNIESMIGKLIQVEYQGSGPMENGPYKGKNAHLTPVSLIEEDVDHGQDSDESDDL
jgi:hypothetical protein